MQWRFWMQRFGVLALGLIAACWLIAASAEASPLGERAGSASLSIVPAVAKSSADSQAVGRSYIGLIHTVPLRFHLLKSDESSIMNATADADLVTSWVAAANDVYAPAGIRFEVERVLRESVRNVTGYDEFASDVQRRIRARREAGRRGKKTPGATRGKYKWRNLLPLDQRIDHGIDVFVAGRVVGAGGYYLCGPRAIVVSERQMRREHISKHALTLSHELGHALGLRHTRCTDEGNVMKKPCSRHFRGKPPLTPRQIIVARAAAAEGLPQHCRRRARPR